MRTDVASLGAMEAELSSLNEGDGSDSSPL